MDVKNIQIYYFSGLLAIVIGLAFFLFLPFLNTMIVAAIFAYLFYPLYQGVHRVVKSETVAATTTLLMALVVALLPIAFIGSLLFQEVRDVLVQVNMSGASGFGDYIGLLDQRLAEFFPNITFNTGEYVRQALARMAESLGTIFTGAAAIGVDLFIGLIAFTYLLRNGERIIGLMKEYSPLENQYDDLIFEKLGGAINSVIKGSLVTAAIQGTVSGLGFFLFGLVNPVLLGTVTAIAALIPGLGTSLVFIPVVLYLFFTGATVPAIGLALWGALAVGFIDNIIGPYIMSRGIKIHPFLVLLSVFAGLSFFGILGFLLGPIILSLLLVLLSIYPKIIGKSA